MENSSVVSTVLFLLLKFMCISTVEIPSDFSDYCPYTSLCTQEARLSLNATDAPCCLPCSCSSRCGLVGRCCPDVADNTNVSQIYPCRNLNTIFRKYLKAPRWFVSMPILYLVIDDCPLDSYSRPELSESIAICHNATGIEDMIFATGVASGLTYLNKHCAMCNQEHLFTEWNMYLQVKSLILPGVSVQERDEYILSRGGVVIVPPTSEIGYTALCHISRWVIETCNVTAKWNFYDVELERRCTQESIGIIYYKYAAYANVHCFLCNSPKDTPAPSECQAVNFIYGVGNNICPPFSALLLSRLPSKETTVCAIGETMDPFREQCTSLICPVGAFPMNGECVDVVKDVTGFYVRLQMGVKIDSQEVSSITDDELIKQDIITVITDHLKKNGMGCGICKSYLPVSSTGVTGFVHLLTNISCKPTDVLNGIARFLRDAKHRMYLPTTALSVTVSNRADLYMRNVVNYADLCENYDIVFTNKIVVCPSILLSADELPRLPGYEKVKTLIAANSVEVDNNGTIRVCIKNYISILNKSQLLSMSKSHEGNMIMLILTTALLQMANGF